MNVVDSFKILFRLSQTFGVFPFTLENLNGSCHFVDSRNRLIYSVILLWAFLVAETGYMLGYTINQNFDFAPEISSKTVMFMSCGSLLVSVPLTFLVVVTKRRSLLFWLNNLNDVFSGLPESRRRETARFSTSLVLSSGILLLTIELLECLIIFEPTSLTTELMRILPFFKGWLVVFFVGIWTVKIFVLYFLTFVNLIREFHEECHKIFNGDGKENIKFWLRVLRDIRSRDLMVKEFVEFLHGFFMPVVSLQLLWGFSSSLFNVTVAARVGIPPAMQLMWAIYIVWDVLVVVSICHLTESKAEKTAHYLHSGFICCEDEEMKEEIELLSLQVQHTKVEFHALGFCKVNFTMICTMIGSLTSYVVIILQFQNDASEEILCSKKLQANCSLDYYNKIQL